MYLNFDECIYLTVYTGGQIMTPSTSQCGVNYLDLGSGTTMDLPEFYQAYVNDPTVTSLSDCTHLCDVDSQCKAIGYMNDISGVSCGLSESDHVTATACPSCHVFTKNCSAGNQKNNNIRLSTIMIYFFIKHNYP